MHIEILVEDSSGAMLLEVLLPQLLGPQGESNTWRVHAYKGIGKIPQGIGKKADPAKRILLDQLPKLLRGYGKTPGIDAVVIVLDTDKRDCIAFLSELKVLADGCKPVPKTMFRLAIEEIEAWYFGDREALILLKEYDVQQKSKRLFGVRIHTPQTARDQRWYHRDRCPSEDAERLRYRCDPRCR